MIVRSFVHVLLALAALGLAAPGSAHAAPPPCTKYASLAGSDAISDGSDRFPYRTVGKLVANLGAGGTGCLVGPGTFADEPPVVLDDPDLTLRSRDPDQRATIEGRIVIPVTAPRATLTALTIDGSQLAATQIVEVRGADAHLVGNEIRSNNQLVCVYAPAASATGLVVEGNRIHRCESAVSLQRTRGARIVDNEIYRHGQAGTAAVLLYPDAESSLIDHNTIANNVQGVRFAGDASTASDTNRVERNVITLSTERNVAYNWDGPVGTSNAVTANCLDGGSSGNIPSPHPGFTVTASKSVGDARYVNPGADEYTLQNGSGCTGYGVLPGAQTSAASAIEPARAVLNGAINPHFQAAAWHFEYGPGSALSSSTAQTSIGGRSVATDVAAAVDLQPSTTYSYRVVAVNPSGAGRVGATRTLTTPAAPGPEPTPTPTPTPTPDPDGDQLVAPADRCPTLHRGRFDTNRNGCPGPMRRVAARDVVPITDRGIRGGKLVSLRVNRVDVVTERGARVTVRCRGQGRPCKGLRGSAVAKRNGQLRFKKRLPRVIGVKSVLIVRVTKRGRAGRVFELGYRLRSRGWRTSKRQCIPIGSTRPVALSACDEITS